MHYVSTRGKAPKLSFEDAVLAGLAEDGGLYVPEKLPEFSPAQMAGWAGLTYQELACRILEPFTAPLLSGEGLREVVEQAYSTFTHTAIAPLKQLDSRHHVLELFHGPTFAFKDFALQFLGLVLDRVLEKRGQHAVVLGATSGDTGSAAIAGFKHSRHADIFILHPQGRTSEIQRRQMTTVADKNVHNIAINGTFDDCQDIVKALFSDQEFRKAHNMVAVNSINWARIAAQTVYYFYAALQLGAPAHAVSFCVPTGNFGNIYAGWLAMQMGLPVKRLIIGTNVNDILARTVMRGEYALRGVTPSLSPSMDIQVSSNFERLLFDLSGHDGTAVAEMIAQLRRTGKLALPAPILTSLRRYFEAHAVDDAATLATIKQVYEQTGEILDPHTAVGVAAARACCGEGHEPVITLGTAHPAKFPDAVMRAIGKAPQVPAPLAAVMHLPERYETLANDVAKVRTHIQATLKN